MKTCKECGWMLEPLMFGNNNEFHMMIEHNTLIKAYKYYECPNPNCGAVTVFRNREMDKPIDPSTTKTQESTV